MKNNKHNINVHIVHNSKPVGKVFRRKKTVQSGINSQNFKFKNVSKMGSTGLDFKQNHKSKTIGKFAFLEMAADNVHVITKNSNEMSKKTKWQRNEQSKSPLLPVNKDGENKNTSNTLPAAKRKFSEINLASSVQEKLKKKKELDDVEKRNQNNNICTSDTKPKMDNPVKPNKKKRRKKKKKKKASEAEDPASTQYKPVLFVKGPNDFSANWKNLKEIITRGDKEQAAKIKEAEEKRENIKQRKSMIGNRKQGENKSGQNVKGNKTIKAHKVQGTKHEDFKKKKKKKKKDEIWFDNVDPLLLGEEYEEEEKTESTEAVADEGGTDKPEKEKGIGEESKEGESKAIAIDCEMVGVGLNGKESMLARVSIVDQYCKLIYDKYVKAQEPVVDYRTEFSGIRPEDIKDAPDFKTVQSDVAKFMEGKILVGHGIDNDLRALFLQHPRSRIRDTSRYKPFKTMFRGHTPKLKMLTKKILGVEIQTGEHDSIQDAQATMRIYTVHHREWDKMKKKVFEKSTKKKVKTKEMPPST